MRALVILVVAAAAGDAAAEPSMDAVDRPSGPTWTFQLGSAERWPTHRSAVALTESTLDGVTGSVERRVFTAGLPGPLPVAVVTAIVIAEEAGADGRTFDQLVNRIDTWQVTAGARARVPIRSWLLAHARAGIGGGRTTVRIADAAMPGGAVRDRGAIAVATGGVGLAVLPRLTRRERRGLHLGAELELGYQVTTAPEIHAVPEDRPPPELTIPARHASIGALDLDGWTARLSLVIGF
jgi:hypothetical protein